MSRKQVMPKSEDLSRSLEINAIWTFDSEFATIFNKSCTYITFKSAVKHRQLGYGYYYKLIGGMQCIIVSQFVCRSKNDANDIIEITRKLNILYILLLSICQNMFFCSFLSFNFPSTYREINECFSECGRDI